MILSNLAPYPLHFTAFRGKKKDVFPFVDSTIMNMNLDKKLLFLFYKVWYNGPLNDLRILEVGLKNKKSSCPQKSSQFLLNSMQQN